MQPYRRTILCLLAIREIDARRDLANQPRLVLSHELCEPLNVGVIYARRICNTLMVSGLVDSAKGGTDFGYKVPQSTLDMPLSEAMEQLGDSPMTADVNPGATMAEVQLLG